MTVGSFVFFDTTSTSAISNSYGNIGLGSALTLQVDDFGSGASLNLEVQGAADMANPDNYFPVKVIDMATFKSVKKIEAAGLYMVICSGMSYIRMKSNSGVGNFKAFAVAVS